jgi:hypothetical protein
LLYAGFRSRTGVLAGRHTAQVRFVVVCRFRAASYEIQEIRKRRVTECLVVLSFEFDGKVLSHQGKVKLIE